MTSVGDARYDVAVVGAGPAGSATAIELARGGRRVVLIDKATFPRDKTCGDGLTTGALRRLEALGLRLDSLASLQPIDTLALRSSSGRVARLPLDRGHGIYAAVMARHDLDSALVELAREAGAEVIEGNGFARLGSENDSPHIELIDGTTLVASYVVGADGAWSSLRKAVTSDAIAPRHQPSARPDWYGFRTYVSGVTRQASNEMWIWFDDALLPGYAWSFPLDAHRTNLGLYVMRDRFDSGAALQRAWQEVLHSPFVSSLLGSETTTAHPGQAWPIPTGLDTAQLVGRAGRVLFVGDAAKSADPFSGEGIAQALAGGLALSDAINRCFETPANVAAEYVRATRQTLMRDHLLAQMASRLVASARFQRGVVRACAASSSLSRQVGRWLFEDYPRAALLSPGSIDIADFRRPGAFAA